MRYAIYCMISIVAGGIGIFGVVWQLISGHNCAHTIIDVALFFVAISMCLKAHEIWHNKKFGMHITPNTKQGD